MKRVNLIFLILCLIASIVFAQKPSEIIKEESFNIDDFKTSNVMVLGTTDVVNKSKSDVFQTTFELNNSLNDFIESSFEEALQNEMSDITVVEPEENLLESLANSAKTGKAINSNADYLIMVNYVFIRDRIERGQSIKGTSPVSQGSYRNGTCSGGAMSAYNPVTRVTINFEIWDLKNAKMVVMAETMGQKRIFQSESKALKGALTKSIDNAANYIKNIESYSRILSKL